MKGIVSELPGFRGLRVVTRSREDARRLTEAGPAPERG
jgi:hypothetical protein